MASNKQQQNEKTSTTACRDVVKCLIDNLRFPPGYQSKSYRSIHHGSIGTDLKEYDPLGPKGIIFTTKFMTALAEKYKATGNSSDPVFTAIREYCDSSKNFKELFWIDTVRDAPYEHDAKVITATKRASSIFFTDAKSAATDDSLNTIRYVCGFTAKIFFDACFVTSTTLKTEDQFNDLLYQLTLYGVFANCPELRDLMKQTVTATFAAAPKKGGKGAKKSAEKDTSPTNINDQVAGDQKQIVDDLLSGLDNEDVA